MAEPSFIDNVEPEIVFNDPVQKEDNVIEHASVYMKKLNRKKWAFKRATKSNKKKWSSEQDRRLLHLRTENQYMKWDEFGQKFPFPGRTWQAVRERHRTLTKPPASPRRTSDNSSVGAETEWEYDSETSPDATPEPAGRTKRKHGALGSADENVPRRKILRFSRRSLRGFQPGVSTDNSQTAKSPGHSPSDTASVSVSHHPVPTCTNGNQPEEDIDIKLARQLFAPKFWALIVDEARRRETERKELDTVRRENMTLKAEMNELKEQNSRYQKMEQIERLVSELKKPEEKQNPLASAGNELLNGN